MPNPDRFAKFANALALVLQHPATPPALAHALKRDLLAIAAQLANVSPETILLPRPKVATLNANALFLDFGLAVADVLNDGDLSADTWNAIGDSTGEIEALLQPENAREAEAGRLRGIVKEWANVQGMAMTA